MNKYEFNKNELTEKAFTVYSDSSFAFWKKCKRHILQKRQSKQ